jgi:2-amino-4-hydroxy-6-hydroxymethyldihydropteridine diphosphokinase
MNTIYLGIGTNLGDKKKNIQEAIELISSYSEIKKISSIYETPPFGFESNDSFFNIVTELKTNLDPYELLKRNQETEKRLGREYFNDGKYHSRIIDLDILLFNQEVINTPDLTVPHPHIISRNFVLIPLLEINENIAVPNNPKIQYKKHLLPDHQINIIKRQDSILIAH